MPINEGFMDLMRIFILTVFFIGLAVMAWHRRVQDSFHLTLKDALQKADTVNLQVMMANARIQQAIARISQAQSDLLPHVDGVVSGGRQTVICALRV